jgi:hypothetical protein
MEQPGPLIADIRVISGRVRETTAPD